jgi:hypothetical protein
MEQLLAPEMIDRQAARASHVPAIGMRESTE